MEVQRDALIEALHKKAIALVDLCPPHSPSPPPTHACSDISLSAAVAGADSAADTHADQTAEDPEVQGQSGEGGAGGNQQEMSFTEAKQADGGGWSLFGSGVAKSEEGKGEQVAGSADVALGGDVVAAVQAGEEVTGAVEGAEKGDAGEPGKGGGNGDNTGSGMDIEDVVSRGAGGGGSKDLPEMEAQEALKLFEETYEELRRWCDMSPSKYGLIQVSKERLAGRPACALKVS